MPLVKWYVRASGSNLSTMEVTWTPARDTLPGSNWITWGTSGSFSSQLSKRNSPSSTPILSNQSFQVLMPAPPWYFPSLRNICTTWSRCWRRARSISPRLLWSTEQASSNSRWNQSTELREQMRCSSSSKESKRWHITKDGQPHSCHALFRSHPPTDSISTIPSGRMTDATDAKRNEFYDAGKPDGLSDMHRHWIAGLMKHSKAMTALCCPTVNCYRRLHCLLAPHKVDWGYRRSTGHLQGKKSRSLSDLPGKPPTIRCVQSVSGARLHRGGRYRRDREPAGMPGTEARGVRGTARLPRRPVPEEGRFCRGALLPLHPGRVHWLPADRWRLEGSPRRGFCEVVRAGQAQEWNIRDEELAKLWRREVQQGTRSVFGLPMIEQIDIGSQSIISINPGWIFKYDWTIDSWSMIYDLCSVFRDLWSTIFDLWSMIRVSWSMIHEPRSMIQDQLSLMTNIWSIW